MGGPHFVQVQSKHSFPPYGLPPNYTPPNVAFTFDENVYNSAPIPIESQHPQIWSCTVFYYEKMVDYMPSSFANLVFVGERIEVGLRRGKFDYAASMNSSDRRPGENGENKKEGETHDVATIPTWPNFPLAQQYQYSANISPSHYPPPYQPRTPNHPQRPPPNRPQNPPDAHPRPNATPNTNQNTN
ncbi:hypothetical protein HKD37_01G001065 [Glycine soja]